MKHNQAFTLIELLVVILIIGILAAVALPQYRSVVVKSRYAELMVAADAIYKAEEMYYLANGTYTNNIDELDINIDTSKVRAYTDIRGDGHAAIVFISSRLPQMSYIRFLDHDVLRTRAGRRICRADVTRTDLRNICKNITGTGIESFTSTAYCDYWF